MSFATTKSTERHSLQILNQLYQYDDFMASVASVVDLGCGTGEDLEWWATATTRDDMPEPLNIQCVGVDLIEQLPLARKHANMTYQRRDFETELSAPKKGFDVLWCHDAFHLALNPIKTLSNWWHLGNDGAMLVISVPQTVLVHQRKLAYYLPAQSWYHHTMVSLMRMLAVSGWDCREGFFQQLPQDPWISAAVYKSNQPPRDPKNFSWYELAESHLLPQTACASIHAHGFLRQQDLIIPWLDKSLASMAQL